MDPCDDNSKVLQCTWMNFHIEARWPALGIYYTASLAFQVPGSRFVAFEKPFRVELIFGNEGSARPPVSSRACAVCAPLTFCIHRRARRVMVTLTRTNVCAAVVNW